MSTDAMADPAAAAACADRPATEASIRLARAGGGGGSGGGGGRTTKRHSASMTSIDGSELDIQEPLDIETLTKRILAVLSKYRISQLVFGERVVGCSQGHLHNLLWKPKPFSLLSAHGKRPYYKMQAFLDDDGLEERISQLTSLRGAVSSRKRSHPDDDDSDTESHGRPRKKRVTFSTAQRASLEEFFEEKSYPSRPEIEDIADNLSIPSDTVRFWFNNKRRLEKKRQRESDLSLEATEYNEDDPSDQEDGEDEADDEEAEDEDNNEDEEEEVEEEEEEQEVKQEEQEVKQEEQEVKWQPSPPPLAAAKKTVSRPGNNGSAHHHVAKSAASTTPAMTTANIRPPGPAGAKAKLAVAANKMA